MFLILAVVGLGTLLLAHTAPFPFLLEAFRPGESVWHMPRDRVRPTVYLTFDDGPNPEATPALLDVLAQQQATATFFLIDAHLTDETAPIVRRIFADGHAVALHSDTRALMAMDRGEVAGVLTAATDGARVSCARVQLRPAVRTLTAQPFGFPVIGTNRTGSVFSVSSPVAVRRRIRSSCEPVPTGIAIKPPTFN